MSSKLLTPKIDLWRVEERGNIEKTKIALDQREYEVKVKNRVYHWKALIEMIEMDIWMTSIGLRMRELWSMDVETLQDD